MSEEKFDLTKGGMPLSDGWFRYSSKSQPGKHFYFNRTSGEKSWSNPFNKNASNKTKKGIGKKTIAKKCSAPKLNQGIIQEINISNANTSAAIKRTREAFQSTGVFHSSDTDSKTSTSKRPVKIVKKRKIVTTRSSTVNNNEVAAAPVLQDTVSAQLNNSTTEDHTRENHETGSLQKRSSANERLFKLREQLSRNNNNIPSSSPISKEKNESIKESLQQVVSEKSTQKPLLYNFETLSTNSTNKRKFTKEGLPLFRDKLPKNIVTPSCSTTVQNSDQVEPMVCEPIEASIQSLGRGHDNSASVEDSVLFVVDTNVFIDDMSILKEILTKKDFTLVVPWKVVQELDGLKENKNNHVVSLKARTAIDFLFKNIPNNARIKVQSLRELNNHVYKCDTSDDEILNCCFQHKQNGNNVILATKDKNLHVKAMSNDIKCMTTEELNTLGRTLRPSQSENKADYDLLYKKWSALLLKLLATVLENEMKARFDKLWEKIIFSPPPWTLGDCLQCISKHWHSVFAEVLLRNVETVQQLTKLTQQLDTKVTPPVLDQFRFHTLKIVSVCQIIPEYQDLASEVKVGISNASSIETDQADEEIVAILEKVWIYLSSFAAKVANVCGIQHDLADTVYQNVADTTIEYQFIEKYTQLFGLDFSIKRYLTTADAEAKARHSTFIWEIINRILMTECNAGVTSKGKFESFLTSQRNLLNLVSEKMHFLAELLSTCKGCLIKRQ